MSGTVRKRFHLAFYIVCKRNYNPYFAIEKESGGSEKLRMYPKLVAGIGSGPRIFSGQSMYFFSKHLAKMPGESLFLLLHYSSSPRTYWSGEEDKAILGKHTHLYLNLLGSTHVSWRLSMAESSVCTPWKLGFGGVPKVGSERGSSGMFKSFFAHFPLCKLSFLSGGFHIPE